MFTEALGAVDERQACSVPRDYVRTPGKYRIIASGQGDAHRAEAEAFIRGRFLRSHGAHIATILPTLLLLFDPADQLAAVAGFRCAADEPLFLERYLPASIEQALEAQVTIRVSRDEILEVGNFAAVDSRRAKIFMSFLPACFLERSARWIVFTATASIRGMLASMGAHCLELATADGTRVEGGVDAWGRYYSNDPRVIVRCAQPSGGP